LEDDPELLLPLPLLPVTSLIRDISVSLTLLNICAVLSACSLISSAI
jgi:hypothetical protein